MVAKKRTTLRNKAAAAAAAKSQDEVETEEIDTSSRSFLHQPRESKREKQLNKQQGFLNRVMEKSTGRDDFAGISKSAIRRRKRKLKEDLKPKMDDLLTSLGQEDDLKQHVMGNSGDEAEEERLESKNKVVKVVSKPGARADEPGFVQIKKNEPSIRKQKGAKLLSIRESSRMSGVLHNSSFQQNPFGSLREAILMKQQQGHQ